MFCTDTDAAQKLMYIFFCSSVQQKRCTRMKEYSLVYDITNKLCLFMFQDRGSPPRSTNATVRITVQDNDDLPPKFSADLYRTQIPEFYPLLVSNLC